MCRDGMRGAYSYLVGPCREGSAWAGGRAGRKVASRERPAAASCLAGQLRKPVAGAASASCTAAWPAPVATSSQPLAPASSGGRADAGTAITDSEDY